MSRKYVKHGFYVVYWIDSQTEGGWDSPRTLKFPKKGPVSIGYFVAEDETYVTLAADYDEETKHYNRFVHIPKVCIKKVKRVRLPSPA